MIRKVKAKYANGVLTPLEPLDLDEGAVVMVDIELESYRDVDRALSDIKKELERIYLLPDGDPKKYKLFLDAEDVLNYLESERRSMERRG